MVKVLFVALIIMAAVVSAYADEAQQSGDNFISSTLSDILGKVNQYTSGEKHIMSEDAEGMNKDVGYTEDALGRKTAIAGPNTGKEAALEEPIH